MNSATEKTEPPVLVQPEATTLREISKDQWRYGIAAWLGWLFDGLDMHLYTLVSGPFVAQLMHLTPTHDEVKAKASWIQASFLIGWALGGGFFGRIGDRIGRSRALSLTVLTYAMFTGLSFFAQSWHQLLVFRFLAALGIGGEWAVGSAMLAETWPKKWRPWLAAVLQTGVNLGVLLACGTDLLRTFLKLDYHYIFLAGVVPAILVFWIRKNLSEPEEWQKAKNRARGNEPKIWELFQGGVLPITVLTIVVCASSLTAWWAFMFWNPHHIRSLPDIADWTAEHKQNLVTWIFFGTIGTSIFGNFFAAFLAKLFGYRKAVSLMCLGFLVSILYTFWSPRTHQEMTYLSCAVGFFSGVFGLFTMYLPPLFPTLLRTTGAGFCYNIGRIAAAAGTVYFGLYSKVGDFQTTLFYAGLLFIPAAIVALFLPEPKN